MQKEQAAKPVDPNAKDPNAPKPPVELGKDAPDGGSVGPLDGKAADDKADLGAGGAPLVSPPPLSTTQEGDDHFHFAAPATTAGTVSGLTGGVATAGSLDPHPTLGKGAAEGFTHPITPTPTASTFNPTVVPGGGVDPNRVTTTPGQSPLFTNNNSNDISNYLPKLENSSPLIDLGASNKAAPGADLTSTTLGDLNKMPPIDPNTACGPMNQPGGTGPTDTGILPDLYNRGALGGTPEGLSSPVTTGQGFSLGDNGIGNSLGS